MEAKPETRTMATFGDRITTQNNPQKFSMEISFENITINDEYYCGKKPRRGRTRTLCKSGNFDGSGLRY